MVELEGQTHLFDKSFANYRKLFHFSWCQDFRTALIIVRCEAQCEGETVARELYKGSRAALSTRTIPSDAQPGHPQVSPLKKRRRGQIYNF